jgi:hypothetical protein
LKAICKNHLQLRVATRPAKKFRSRHQQKIFLRAINIIRRFSGTAKKAVLDSRVVFAALPRAQAGCAELRPPRLTLPNKHSVQKASRSQQRRADLRHA